jgi:acetate kinase
MQKNLIVNTGSVSAKYSLYEGEQEVFFGHFEIEKNQPIVTYFKGGRTVPGETKNITQEIFQNSLSVFIDEVIAQGIIKDKLDIARVAVRIVAPGTGFQSDAVIDDEFIARLTEQKEEAPLHVPVALKEIENIQAFLPEVKIIGISDSAYYHEVPEVARRYAISKDLAEKYDVYHFGYHGISAESVAEKVKQQYGDISKIVICHLGGGSSVIAVKDGKPIDTSMGYSPLQGLMSSTRSGDIDPIAVLYLKDKLGLDAEATEKFFNTQGGLIGISKVSSDVRDLIDAEVVGNEDAGFALTKFVNSIQKYIGAFTAELGGIDTLVFSGTIGERSFIMRKRILHGLGFLGLSLDTVKNDASVAIDAEIQTVDSKARILIVKTDEMAEMAKRVGRI